MTDKQFHDGILQQGPIPIEMIRAAFTGQRLTSDFTTNWKFYGAIQPAP